MALGQAAARVQSTDYYTCSTLSSIKRRSALLRVSPCSPPSCCVALAIYWLDAVASQCFIPSRCLCTDAVTLYSDVRLRIVVSVSPRRTSVGLAEWSRFTLQVRKWRSPPVSPGSVSLFGITVPGDWPEDRRPALGLSSTNSLPYIDDNAKSNCSSV